MRVEIWSDTMCPFCYMGKRRFERALGRFEHRGEVDVLWRSFQLDPSIENVPGRTLNEYLAERKGISVERTAHLHDRLTEEAKELGLAYNFDRVRVANSFDAHRLVHLASARGLQDAAEERLFRAYFTEGRNLADRETLVELGSAIGLDPEEVRRTLAGDSFSEEVRSDIREAEALGIEGVPFFVIDRTYAVSGAQPAELFLEVLEKVWAEHPTATAERKPASS